MRQRFRFVDRFSGLLDAQSFTLPTLYDKPNALAPPVLQVGRIGF
jgi:hypothetical protein